MKKKAAWVLVVATLGLGFIRFRNHLFITEFLFAKYEYVKPRAKENIYLCAVDNDSVSV